MPLIRDPSFRASLYPESRAAAERPARRSREAEVGKATYGRLCPDRAARKGTLTLAEVEVRSDGRNVAPPGKASQKNTAYGGDA